MILVIIRMRVLAEKRKELSQTISSLIGSTEKPSGCRGLLKAMLPILDNLECTIDHGEKMNETGPLLQAVEITLRQLLNILERFGVKPVAAVGEAFDPEKHEAVYQAESDQEPNRVIYELEKGYLFHERLLRPAKVVVSKAQSEKETETK